MTRWQPPTPRPTREELNMVLDDLEVEAGESWQHVASGSWYLVVTTALREDDHEPVVVYQPRDGEGPVWTRPVAEFVKRFRLVH